MDYYKVEFCNWYGMQQNKATNVRTTGLYSICCKINWVTIGFSFPDTLRENRTKGLTFLPVFPARYSKEVLVGRIEYYGCWFGYVARCTYKNTENIEYCGNHTTCCIYVALKYNAPPFKKELKALKNELNGEQTIQNRDREIEKKRNEIETTKKQGIKNFEFWVLFCSWGIVWSKKQTGRKRRKDNNSICRRTAYFADSLSFVIVSACSKEGSGET